MIQYDILHPPIHPLTRRPTVSGVTYNMSYAYTVTDLQRHSHWFIDINGMFFAARRYA